MSKNKLHRIMSHVFYEEEGNTPPAGTSAEQEVPTSNSKTPEDEKTDSGNFDKKYTGLINDFNTKFKKIKNEVNKTIVQPLNDNFENILIDNIKTPIESALTFLLTVQHEQKLNNLQFKSKQFKDGQIQDTQGIGIRESVEDKKNSLKEHIIDIINFIDEILELINVLTNIETYGGDKKENSFANKLGIYNSFTVIKDGCTYHKNKLSELFKGFDNLKDEAIFTKEFIQSQTTSSSDTKMSFDKFLNKLKENPEFIAQVNLSQYTNTNAVKNNLHTSIEDIIEFFVRFFSTGVEESNINYNPQKIFTEKGIKVQLSNIIQICTLTLESVKEDDGIIVDVKSLLNDAQGIIRNYDNIKIFDKKPKDENEEKMNFNDVKTKLKDEEGLEGIKSNSKDSTGDGEIDEINKEFKNLFNESFNNIKKYKFLEATANPQIKLLRQQLRTINTALKNLSPTDSTNITKLKDLRKKILNKIAKLQGQQPGSNKKSLENIVKELETKHALDRQIANIENKCKILKPNTSISENILNYLTLFDSSSSSSSSPTIDFGKDKTDKDDRDLIDILRRLYSKSNILGTIEYIEKDLDNTDRHFKTFQKIQKGVNDILYDINNNHIIINDIFNRVETPPPTSSPSADENDWWQNDAKLKPTYEKLLKDSKEVISFGAKWFSQWKKPRLGHRIKNKVADTIGAIQGRSIRENSYEYNIKKLLIEKIFIYEDALPSKILKRDERIKIGRFAAITKGKVTALTKSTITKKYNTRLKNNRNLLDDFSQLTDVIIADDNKSLLDIKDSNEYKKLINDPLINAAEFETDIEKIKKYYDNIQNVDIPSLGLIIGIQNNEYHYIEYEHQKDDTFKKTGKILKCKFNEAEYIEIPESLMKKFGKFLFGKVVQGVKDKAARSIVN